MAFSIYMNYVTRLYIGKVMFIYLSPARTIFPSFGYVDLSHNREALFL